MIKFGASLLVSFLLFSCANKNKIVYTLPSGEEINSIIETIIVQDSIQVFVKNDLPDTIHLKGEPDLIRFPIKNLFSVDLTKLHVSFPSPNYYYLESLPQGMQIKYSTLIRSGPINNRNFFSPSDSAYFVFQNGSINSFTFNSGILNTIYTTTQQKQEDRGTSYFSCSIPVFSTDKTKAYVELTYNCYWLCGYACSYLLKKENERWKIVRKERLWIS